MKKIDKNQIHTVYFKIKTENNEEDHNILKTYNFINFFADFDIRIETYSIKFLIDSNGEYFMKFEIKYQSLESILEQLNNKCIINDCHEKITETDEIFCLNHSYFELIKANDIETINNYFKIRNQKLEQSYHNYLKQSDLVNYLKKHPRNDNNGQFKVCNFELILTSETDDLLEIKLNLEEDSDFSDSNDIDFNVSINDIEELSIDDSDSNGDSDGENDDMNIKKLRKCFDNIMSMNISNDNDIEDSDDENSDDSDDIENIEDMDDD